MTFGQILNPLVMVIIQLDSDQLFDVIENAVRKVLSEQHKTAAATSDGKTVLNLQQFCQHTGLSPQTAYKLTAKALVPHSKRGKRVYFEKSQVDAWLLQNRVGVTSNNENKANQYTIENRRRRGSK